jgi:hypothetical protein
MQRAQNPIPEATADGLRILIHEELHGHSRMTTRSYLGIGIKLEEVGTELNARRITGDVLGRPHRYGAYQDEIDRTRRAVRAGLGSRHVTNDELDGLIARAHERGVLGPGADFQSPNEALDSFLGGLDVTSTERDAIRRNLEVAFDA